MPVTFSILPHRNVTIFTYFGSVAMKHVTEGVAAAAAHPDYRDGMRHFCDLSRVTEVEKDFPAFFKMQAKLAESFINKPVENIVVFYAPSPVAQTIARMAQQTWAGLNSVIVLTHEDESEALAMLGLPERSLKALLAETP